MDTFHNFDTLKLSKLSDPYLFSYLTYIICKQNINYISPNAHKLTIETPWAACLNGFFSWLWAFWILVNCSRCINGRASAGCSFSISGSSWIDSCGDSVDVTIEWGGDFCGGCGGSGGCVDFTARSSRSYSAKHIKTHTNSTLGHLVGN